MYQHTDACRAFRPPDDEMIPVNSWDEVPDFANECEEHMYWSMHSFGPSLLEQFRTVGEP